MSCSASDSVEATTSILQEGSNAASVVLDMVEGKYEVMNGKET